MPRVCPIQFKMAAMEEQCEEAVSSVQDHHNHGDAANIYDYMAYDILATAKIALSDSLATVKETI